MEVQSSQHILSSQIRKTIRPEQYQYGTPRDKILQSNKLLMVISKKISQRYYKQLTPQIQRSCGIHITQLNDNTNLQNIVSILQVNHYFYGFIILNSQDYLKYRQVLYSLLTKYGNYFLKNLKIIIQKESQQDQSRIESQNQFYSTNSEIAKVQSQPKLIEYIASPQKLIGQKTNHFLAVIIKHRRNIGYQIKSKVIFLYEQSLGNEFHNKLESLKNEKKMIKYESFKRQQLKNLIENENIRNQEFIIAITESFLNETLNLIKQKSNIKILLISSKQQKIGDHPFILRQANEIEILQFINQIFSPKNISINLEQNSYNQYTFEHQIFFRQLNVTQTKINPIRILISKSLNVYNIHLLELRLKLFYSTSVTISLFQTQQQLKNYQFQANYLNYIICSEAELPFVKQFSKNQKKPYSIILYTINSFQFLKLIQDPKYKKFKAVTSSWGQLQKFIIRISSFKNKQILFSDENIYLIFSTTNKVPNAISNSDISQQIKSRLKFDEYKNFEHLEKIILSMSQNSDKKFIFLFQGEMLPTNINQLIKHHNFQVVNLGSKSALKPEGSNITFGNQSLIKMLKNIELIKIMNPKIKPHIFVQDKDSYWIYYVKKIAQINKRCVFHSYNNESQLKEKMNSIINNGINEKIWIFINQKLCANYSSYQKLCTSPNIGIIVNSLTYPLPFQSPPLLLSSSNKLQLQAFITNFNKRRFYPIAPSYLQNNNHIAILLQQQNKSYLQKYIAEIQVWKKQLEPEHKIQVHLYDQNFETLKKVCLKLSKETVSIFALLPVQINDKFTESKQLSNIKNLKKIIINNNGDGRPSYYQNYDVIFTSQQEDNIIKYLKILRYHLKNPPQYIQSIFKTELINIFINSKSNKIKYIPQFKRNESLVFHIYNDNQDLVQKINSIPNKQQILILGSKQAQEQLHKINKKPIKFICNNHYSKEKSSTTILSSNQEEQISCFIRNLPKNRYIAANAITTNTTIYFKQAQNTHSIYQQCKKMQKAKPNIHVQIYKNISDIQNQISASNNDIIFVCDQKNKPEIDSTIEKHFKQHKNRWIVLLGNSHQTSQKSHVLFKDSNPKYIQNFFQNILYNEIEPIEKNSMIKGSQNSWKSINDDKSQKSNQLMKKLEDSGISNIKNLNQKEKSQIKDDNMLVLTLKQSAIKNQHEFLGQLNQSDPKSNRALNNQYSKQNTLDQRFQYSRPISLDNNKLNLTQEEMRLKRLEYYQSQSKNKNYINSQSQNKNLLNQYAIHNLLQQNESKLKKKLEMEINLPPPPETIKSKHSSMISQHKIMQNKPQQNIYKISKQQSRERSLHYSNHSKQGDKSQEDFFGLDHNSSQNSQIKNVEVNEFKSKQNSKIQPQIFDQKSVASKKSDFPKKKSVLEKQQIKNSKINKHQQEKSHSHRSQISNNFPQIIIHTNGTESEVHENNIINTMQLNQRDAQQQNIVIIEPNNQIQKKDDMQKSKNNIKIQGQSVIKNNKEFQKIKSNITEKSNKSNKSNIQAEKNKSIVVDKQVLQAEKIKSTITEKSIKSEKLNVQPEKMKSTISMKAQKLNNVQPQKMKSNITQKSNKQPEKVKSKIVVQPQIMKSTITEKSMKSEKLNVEPEKIKSTITQKSNKQPQKMKSIVVDKLVIEPEKNKSMISEKSIKSQNLNIEDQKIKSKITEKSNKQPQKIKSIVVDNLIVEPEKNKSMISEKSIKSQKLNIEDQKIKSKITEKSNKQPQKIKSIVVDNLVVQPQLMKSTITQKSMKSEKLNVQPEKIKSKITEKSNKQPQKIKSIVVDKIVIEPEKNKSTITQKSIKSEKLNSEPQKIKANITKLVVQPQIMKSTITEKSMKSEKLNVQPEKLKSNITQKSNKQSQKMKSIVVDKLIVQPQKMKSTITQKSNRQPQKIKHIVADMLFVQPEQNKSMISEKSMKSQKLNVQPQKMKSNITEKSMKSIKENTVKLQSLKFNNQNPPNPPEILNTNTELDQASVKIVKPFYNNPNKSLKTQIWIFYSNNQQSKRILNYIQKSTNRANIRLKAIPINTFSDVNQTLQYGHSNIDKVLIILKDENIKSENIVYIQQKYPKSRIYTINKNIEVIQAGLIFDLGFMWQQFTVPYKSKSIKNISSDNTILFYPQEYPNIYVSDFKISTKYQNLEKLENELSFNQNPNIINLVITTLNNLKNVEKLALKYGLTKIIVISQTKKLSKWDFFQNYGDILWLMVNTIQQINRTLNECIYESSKQPFQTFNNILFYTNQQSDIVSDYKCTEFFKIKYSSDKDLLQKLSRLKINNNVYILHMNQDQLLFVNLVNCVYLKNLYYHIDFSKKYLSSFKYNYYENIIGLLEILKDNRQVTQNSCLPLIYDKNEESSLYILKKYYPYFKYLQIQYKPKQWILPSGEFILQTDQYGQKKQKLLTESFSKQLFLTYPIYKFFYLSSLVPKVQTQLIHKTAEELLQTYKKFPHLLMILFCDNGDEKYIPIQLQNNTRVRIIRFCKTFELKFDSLYLTGIQIQGVINKIKMIQNSFKSNYVIYKSAKNSETEKIIKSIQSNFSNVKHKQYNNITDLSNVISQIKNRSLFMDILFDYDDFPMVQNILKQNNIQVNYKLHKLMNNQNQKFGTHNDLPQLKTIKQTSSTPLIANPPQISNQVYYNYGHEKVKKLASLAPVSNQTLIIPDVSTIVMIDNDGEAKQNMKFLLNNSQLQKQLIYYTRNNLSNKLMEAENKTIILIIQGEKQLNAYQELIQKIKDIFIIVKSPKDNIIYNGRYIKDWSQLQNIFKQLTINQENLNKLFDKSQKICIIFDQTLSKQQKILVYLITDESNKAKPIKLNTIQKHKQLLNESPQTLFLLYSHKDVLQKMFKNNPNAFRLWRKQLQNLYLHLNPNRKEMENLISDKNKMNVVLNNKLISNKVKINNFTKPEVLNSKKLQNSVSPKNNLPPSNFKVQALENRKKLLLNKQQINDDKINDLLSQKRKEITYNEIMRKQQNRKKKVMTQSSPNKINQIKQVNQQYQNKQKVQQQALKKFYPILNGQIIKLFVSIERSELKFLVNKKLSDIMVILYGDITTLERSLRDHAKYPVILILEQALHAQANSILSHNPNLRIISQKPTEIPSIAQVTKSNQQLLELLKKLLKKNKQIERHKNKNSPSQEFNGYSIHLPLKNANQKVSLYYHELKNTSIRITVQKYSAPRINYVPYKNINHLKQLLGNFTIVDELGIIIGNDSDIEEIQKLNTFQRPIFYIRIFNQVITYKKIITDKILYSGNSQKQVANHIISLVYRSFKKLSKKTETSTRLRSIRSLKSIRSLNALKKNQIEQKAPLSEEKQKKQIRGSRNLPTTFGRSPRFQYFYENMQLRQNRKSQKHNVLPFINNLQRVRSNDKIQLKKQFKRLQEYGM